LELENKRLKMGSAAPYSQEQKNEDKNWLSGGFGTSGQNFYKSGASQRPGIGQAPPMTMERPMTAAGGNQKVRELET